MRKWILTAVILLLSPIAWADDTPNLYTIQDSSAQKILYFRGAVEPINSIPVISPTEGVVKTMGFTYGQIVSKGRTLFTVDATKLQESLRDARVNYLNALEKYQKVQNWQDSNDMLSAQDALVRAKSALDQAKVNYQENQRLFKLQIISRQALEQSADSYHNSMMSYKQAQRSLAQTQRQGQGDQATITKLQFNNAKDKYMSLLHQAHNTMVTAPATGIALIPDEESSSGNNSGKGKVKVGSSVTYQETLINIGNLNGIKVSVDVPELHINQIKKGQKALLTGSGFPNITLHGVVTEVGAQAKSGSGGSANPTFPILIEVKQLPKAAKKLVKAGMESQVALSIYQASHAITIPVNAVSKDKQGHSVVTVYDPQTKKQKTVQVTTGVVMQDTVEITKGLHKGQQVVVPDGNSS